MAVPSIVDSGLAFASASAAVWPKPAACLTNDILILLGETANQSADTPLFYDDSIPGPGAGAFTPITQVGTGTAGGTTATRIVGWWRRIDGSEVYPINQFYQEDPGDHQIYGYLVARGCVTSGDPIDASATSLAASASTSVAFPGLTTLGADRLLISAVANAIDAASGQLSGTPTNADLTDIAVLFNLQTTAGNGGGIAAFSGKRVAAGAVGAGAGTLLASSVQARLTFALKPPVVAESAGGFWL